MKIKTRCTRWDEHTPQRHVSKGSLSIVLTFVINEVSSDFDSENVLASSSADTFFLSLFLSFSPCLLLVVSGAK